MKPHRFAALASLLALLILTSFDAAARANDPTPISYIDEEGRRRIWVFVHDTTTGRLAVSHFNGTSWAWLDHGLPDANTMFLPGDAVTFVDDAGKRRIYVFGVNQSNRLVVRYFNGTHWYWKKLNGPELKLYSISAVTYVNDAGVRRIEAFATSATTGNLLTNYWDGTDWNWGEHSRPAPTDPNATLYDTQSITYVGDDGDRHIDVFCTSYYDGKNKLFARSFNGSYWNWVDHGGENVGFPSPITYKDTGPRVIHVWLENDPWGAANDTLRTRRWDGTQWLWLNAGNPEPAMSLRESAATTFVDLNGIRQIHAFTLISGQLYRRSWTGSGWFWADQSTPASYNDIDSIVALSYVNPRAEVQNMHVFATSNSGDLVFNYWNGSSWTWVNNGQP